MGVRNWQKDGIKWRTITFKDYLKLMNMREEHRKKGWLGGWIEFTGKVHKLTLYKPAKKFDTGAILLQHVA